MHFLKHSDALLIATELIDYDIGQPLEARAIPMRLAVLLGAREVLFLSEMYAFGGEGDHIKSGNLLLATDHYNLRRMSKQTRKLVPVVIFKHSFANPLKKKNS